MDCLPQVCAAVKKSRRPPQGSIAGATASNGFSLAIGGDVPDVSPCHCGNCYLSFGVMMRKYLSDATTGLYRHYA